MDAIFALTVSERYCKADHDIRRVRIKTLVILSILSDELATFQNRDYSIRYKIKWLGYADPKEDTMGREAHIECYLPVVQYWLSLFSPSHSFVDDLQGRLVSSRKDFTLKIFRWMLSRWKNEPLIFSALVLPLWYIMIFNKRFRSSYVNRL